MIPPAHLPVAALLSTGAWALLGAVSAAQSNASSSLMTYGDVPGQAATATLWNTVNPNKPAIFVPSLLNTTSQYLVTQTGDPNDLLSVGIDLAAAGTYFQGATNAAGTASVNFVIPPAAPLGLAVYWQSFTVPGGGGAGQYQDFSFQRFMSLNGANSWQNARSDLPVAASNLAWDVTARGPNGRPTQLFACGGGPAMVTAPTTPYPTNDQAWYYDARTETHRLVNGRLNTSRAFHTVTALPGGKILVTGGVTFGGQKPNGSYYTRVLNDAEVYDPVSDTWTVVPTTMQDYRAGHSATLLDNGLVLIAGGTEGDANHELTNFTSLLGTEVRTAELFDPATGTWTATAPPNLTEPKAGHAAVKLADGRVALLGGVTWTTILGIRIPDFSSAVTLYDPAAGAAGSMTSGGNIGIARALFAAALLPNGKIACVGGVGPPTLNPGPIAQAHLYDPAAMNATAMTPLPVATAFAVARLDAQNPNLVWVVGGAKGTIGNPDPVDTLYRYDTSSGAVSSFAVMPIQRGGGVVEVLEDRTLYTGGGETNSGISTADTDSYSP